MTKPLLTACFCLLASGFLSAQSAALPDFLVASREQVIKNYHRATAQKSRLYIGPVQSNYPATYQGSAFFETNLYSLAKLRYYNLDYDSVSILYDAYKDQVISLAPNKVGVQLLKEKLQSFEYLGHRFVRHDADNLPIPAAPPGFYEHLLDGKKITALSKRMVLLEEKVTDKLEQKFINAFRYYVKLDNNYNVFFSYRALIRILDLKKGVMKRHLYSKGINPKQQQEAAIRETLAYYEANN